MKALRGLNFPEAIPVQRFQDSSVFADFLDGIPDRDGRHDRLQNPGFRDNPVNQIRSYKRPGPIVDEDEIHLGSQSLQAGIYGILPFGPSRNDAGNFCETEPLYQFFRQLHPISRGSQDHDLLDSAAGFELPESMG